MSRATDNRDSQGVFNIGDRVWWTSKSAGSVATKVGAITEIVPIGVVPEGISAPGRGRDHVSYIVVASANGRPEKRYWPRVSMLEPASGEGPLVRRCRVKFGGVQCHLGEGHEQRHETRVAGEFYVGLIRWNTGDKSAELAHGE